MHLQRLMECCCLLPLAFLRRGRLATLCASPSSYLSSRAELPQGGKSGSLLADRRAAWQEAFRGLFYALRNHLCDVFYLETPPVSSRCTCMACRLRCLDA